MTKKRLFTAAKIVFAIAIIYFMYTRISVDIHQIVSYLRHANGWFFSSILLFTFFLMFQGWNWLKILNYPNKLLSVRTGLLIFINSQFAKYIPGGIWNYVGRIYLANRAGVPMQPQIIAIIVENILLVMAAAVYALILVYLLKLAPVIIVLLGAAVFVVMFLFYGPVTRLIERTIHRFVKKYAGVKLTVPRKAFFAFFGYFLVSHFIMGVAFWMLIYSFNIHNVGIFYAAGTFALAWLIGLFSPLPGGIGIREGLIIYLLSFHMDHETAASIAIITRIWNIFSEGLFFAIMNGSVLLKKRKGEQTLEKA